MKGLLQVLIMRYLPLCEKHPNKDVRNRLKGMMVALELHAEDWPADKSSRWIGFVQGVLFSVGLLNVDDEREFTRPLFHEYYCRSGLDIPESIDVVFKQ